MVKHDWNLTGFYISFVPTFYITIQLLFFHTQTLRSEVKIIVKRCWRHTYKVIRGDYLVDLIGLRVAFSFAVLIMSTASLTVAASLILYFLENRRINTLWGFSNRTSNTSIFSHYIPDISMCQSWLIPLSTPDHNIALTAISLRYIIPFSEVRTVTAAPASVSRHSILHRRSNVSPNDAPLVLLLLAFASPAAAHGEVLLAQLNRYVQRKQFERLGRVVPAARFVEGFGGGRVALADSTGRGVVRRYNPCSPPSLPKK